MAPLPRSEISRQQTSVKAHTSNDGYDGRIRTGRQWIQRIVAGQTLYATAEFALSSLI